MNKIHRVLWSAFRQAFVVVHEKASSGRRCSAGAVSTSVGVSSRLGLLTAALALAYPMQVWATCTGSSGSFTVDATCTSVTISGGATATNAQAISSSSGVDTGTQGSAGTAVVLMTGGSLASPDVLNNSGTLTNTLQPATSTSSKGVYTNGYATINNSGTISETGYLQNTYSSGILDFASSGGGQLNVSNLGTISGSNFGIAAQGPVGSIINGSSTNSTAVIAATNLYGVSLNLYANNTTYPTLVNSIDNFAVIGQSGGAVSAINVNPNVEIQQLTNETTGQILGLIGNSGLLDVLQNDGNINGWGSSVAIGNGGTIGTLNNAAGASIYASSSRGAYALNNGGTIGNVGGLNNAGTIDGITNYNANGKIYDLNNTGSIASITNNGLFDALNTNTAISNSGSISNGINNNSQIGSTTATYGVNNSNFIRSVTNSGSILGATGINNTGTIYFVTNNGTNSLISSIVSAGNNSSILTITNGSSTVATSSIGTLSLGAGSTLSTLTNYALISQINNSGTLNTFYNYYTGAAQAYSGTLPVSYYMYIDTGGTLYSQLASTSASGVLKFGLMNAGAAPTNAVYTDVISGVTLADVSSNLATSISGNTLGSASLTSNSLTGTWSNGTTTRSWWLVQDPNNASALNLCFDLYCGTTSPSVQLPNIVTTNNQSQTTANLGNNLFTTLFDGGTLTVSNTTPTVSTSFTIDSNAGFIDTAGNTANFSGTITDATASSGQLHIVNSGSGGAVVLSGANTYSGGTTIDAGATLQIGAANAIGSGSLDLVGAVANNPATLATTANLTITNPATVSGQASVNVASNTVTTITSAIANGVGVGSLNVAGSGLLQLTGTNGYTGTTTVDGGATLALLGQGSIGASSSVVVNGTLDISQNAFSLQTSSGVLTSPGAAITSLSGSGLVQTGNSTQAPSYLALTNASGNFVGNIAGNGGLVVLSGGAQTLSSVNSYTGYTVVDNGATLALGSNAAISASADVLVSGGTLDASTAGATIKSLYGTGAVSLGAQTLTLTNAADGFAGVISGSGGGVTIAGGTENLAGVNTYTGATSIASGATLALQGAGSIAASAGVSNNGSLDISGANGSITLGNYSQTAAGAMKMTIAANNNQQLNVAGSTSLGGTLDLLASAGAYRAGRYTLITSASPLSGSFSNLATDLSQYTALSYRLAYDPNGVYLLLTPSTADIDGSVAALASALQSPFALQTQALYAGLEHDCALFDTHGVCVSVGGRYTVVDSNGPHTTNALVVGGRRVNAHLRVGAWAEQNVSAQTQTSGVHYGTTQPMVGAYSVWTEHPGEQGFGLRLAAGYGSQNLDLNRPVVGNSEAGSGSSQLTVQGVSVELSFDKPLRKGWVATPYAGLRYSRAMLGGYTESSSGGASFPLSFGDLRQQTTTLRGGLRLAGPLSDRVSLHANAGFEQDLDISGGTATVSNSSIGALAPLTLNPYPRRTRAVAGLGASFALGHARSLDMSLTWAQQPYSSLSTSSAQIRFTAGF